ncbi:MAG: SIMPL domain-containing protein, partial [Bacteroidales bacterium]|nr:SIMPL domain-containing protein [Bacteroidales bacterium]
MKKILALLIGIIALSGTICAQENQSLNIIEVSATAHKSVTPDEIYLNITINEKDNKGKISVDQQ